MKPIIINISPYPSPQRGEGIKKESIFEYSLSFLKGEKKMMDLFCYVSSPFLRERIKVRVIHSCFSKERKKAV
jgi:hypothetical protein